MIAPLVLLAAGLLLLIVGADWFVDGAAQLARGLLISPMAVGMTVVAFGTSAPELFVNVAAGVAGSPEIALGNVVGSNIANILLVLGLCAMVRPLTVSRGTVWRAIPFSLLAVIVLWIMAGDVIIDGAFFSLLSRSDGLLLLAFFAVFLAYTVSTAQPVDGAAASIPVRIDRSGAIALKLVVGFFGLLIGGRWVVVGAALVAGRVAIPQSVVGLTVVAVGTSLPELATSVAAARRGALEIAVGNVVGSNIFNIFFILGVSALIRPLAVEPARNIDLGVLLGATLLLFVFMFTGRLRIMDRWEGALALVIYVVYLGYLSFSVIGPAIPAG